MYQIFSRTNLDNVIDSQHMSTQDYVTEKLSQVFLPWPLNMANLLPNWLIITILSLLVLMVVKFFIDPCLALCHLVRDGSMSLIDNVATVCLPAVSISRKTKDALMIKAEEGLPLNNTTKGE